MKKTTYAFFADTAMPENYTFLHPPKEHEYWDFILEQVNLMKGQKYLNHTTRTSWTKNEDASFYTPDGMDIKIPLGTFIIWIDLYTEDK